MWVWHGGPASYTSRRACLGRKWARCANEKRACQERQSHAGGLLGRGRRVGARLGPAAQGSRVLGSGHKERTHSPRWARQARSLAAIVEAWSWTSAPHGHRSQSAKVAHPVEGPVLVGPGQPVHPAVVRVCHSHPQQDLVEAVAAHHHKAGARGALPLSPSAEHHGDLLRLADHRRLCAVGRGEHDARGLVGNAVRGCKIQINQACVRGTVQKHVSGTQQAGARPVHLEGDASRVRVVPEPGQGPA